MATRDRGRRSQAARPRRDRPSAVLTFGVAASAFQQLGIGVSISSGDQTRSIHLVPDSVIELEIEHGCEVERWAHNDRCKSQARKVRGAVWAQHAGFHDLFVPVGDAVLMAGPVAFRHPTTAEVTERWRAISGLQPQLAHPAFSRYLAATLATVTLDGKLPEAFASLMTCFATALRGGAEGMRASAQAEALAESVIQARAAERMWEAARSMVDDRTTHVWSTPLKRDPLAELGMTRAPQHVVVGFFNRSDQVDPIEDALHRHACQRAIANLMRKKRNVICGQVGDHGIVLLAASSETGAERTRATLGDLASAAADCARRLGLRLHAGIARASGSQSLATRYRAALAAADRALSRSLSVVVAEDGRGPTYRSLADLRGRLADSIDGRANVLSVRFERYIAAVVAHVGYQHDATRAHLEAGLERLAEPLLLSGQIDRKAFDELSAPIAESTMTNLVAAYRSVVGELERTLQSPTSARQTRSTMRAIRFVRERLAEPLTLAQVSRVAGFAPGYFSSLLKRDQGVTFERYLQRLRLERAKQILTRTTVRVERVAELSGFKSRTHFQQVFKRQVGETPMAYRERTH